MTNEIVIKEELSKDANNAVITANAMVVTDNPSNEKATNFLKNLKTLQKAISTELRPAIEKANDLHKTLTGQEKRLLAPLKEAEMAIKGKVSTFLVKMENERREEQRKAQEKADADERKIREAKEKQQREWEAKEKAKRDEAERLEKEKNEKEAEAQRLIDEGKSEEARIAKKEAAAKEEEARKAREAADKAAEKAVEREQQAEETFVPATIVENKAERQEGVSTTFNWKFEVVNEMKVPREYLKVDEVAIGQVVRATKGRTKIDGVRIYKEASVSVRTR